MAELKTQPTDFSVTEFIESIEHKTRKSDAFILLKLFQEITQQPAVLWGTSIVGFGLYHYTYDSGCKGDWMKTGFSPRKANLAIYLMNGFEDYALLLSQLGKHKTAKSCLYINKLADVDLSVLKKLVKKSYSAMSKKYG